MNTAGYLAANAIILFGHCLWYAPPVLWLGFIRWEVCLYNALPILLATLAWLMRSTVLPFAKQHVKAQRARLQCLTATFVLFWVSAHNSAPYKLKNGACNGGAMGCSASVAASLSHIDMRTRAISLFAEATLADMFHVRCRIRRWSCFGCPVLAGALVQDVGIPGVHRT